MKQIIPPFKPGDVLVEGTNHIITVTRVMNNVIEYFEGGYFHETSNEYITRIVKNHNVYQYLNNDIDINDFPVGTIYYTDYAVRNTKQFAIKIGDNYFTYLNDRNIAHRDEVIELWNSMVQLPDAFKFTPGICAYIKCSISDLGEALEELGYTIDPSSDSEDSYTYIFNGHVYTTEADQLDDVLPINNAINCEKNDELFLAIAALRDDSDYKQYFVCDVEESWANLELYRPVGSMSYSLVCDFMSINDKKNYHKATIEELVNYFIKNNKK